LRAAVPHGGAQRQRAAPHLGPHPERPARRRGHARRARPRRAERPPPAAGPVPGGHSVINRRVVVNLVAFALLFVLLASWAIRNVVKLDQIERPYEIVAEFESSPGLQPNVEATYLGVSVGSVDSVRLADGHVRVVIDINRGVEIPEGISAAVRRKSAVGEPYIALDPAEGASEAPLIDPSAGYTVPLERTSIPLSYGQLFSSVDELVSAVPAEDLGVVLHELATALDGRGAELREIIAGSEAITTTLATRSESLDELASDLT